MRGVPRFPLPRNALDLGAGNHVLDAVRSPARKSSGVMLPDPCQTSTVNAGSSPKSRANAGANADEPTSRQKKRKKDSKAQSHAPHLREPYAIIELITLGSFEV